MTHVFADTSYYLALLLPDDEHHAAADRLTAEWSGPQVTTTAVLLEVGSHLARPAGRPMFRRLIDVLRGDPAVTIVHLDADLFDKAVELYADRQDKSWSLVDCASFAVMGSRGIADALTADHHFEQAGFRALLR